MPRAIRKSIPQPEWAKSVVRLRAGLVLNQGAFGHAFHCSAMAVSRWERGVSEPQSHIYIEKGRLAARGTAPARTSAASADATSGNREGRWWSEEARRVSVSDYSLAENRCSVTRRKMRERRVAARRRY